MGDEPSGRQLGPRELLALAAAAAAVPTGATALSLAVGVAIRRALDDGSARDADDVSSVTGAGTGCGSRTAVVARVVADHRVGAGLR